VTRATALGVARAASDALLAMVAVAAAFWFRYSVFPGPHNIPGGEIPDEGHYVAAAPVLALVVVTVLALEGVYRNRRGQLFIDEVFSSVRGLAVAAVVVLALIGLYHDFSYSRTTFLYWVIATAALIPLGRFLIRVYNSRRRAQGIGSERALVVGWGAAADLLVQRMRMFPDYGYTLVGVLADTVPKGTEVGEVEVLGGTRQLARIVDRLDVAVVFIALSDVSQDRILQMIDSCRDRKVDFRIAPSMLEIMTTQVTADHLDGIPLLQLRRGLDIDAGAQFGKRAFDLVVTGLGLTLLSPLMALIAVSIKLTSRGPVVIHQDRIGLDGRVFQMHKFRSMGVDAEAGSGPVWASEDDPRRTGVGKLLRRLSLDELPQLFNIVSGDMSLVGPRAERPSFVREFSERYPRYADRLRVRPGLAGWAQSNDLRGQTPVEERLIYDLYYIENWSLSFDLKILLITLFRVWTHKNAY
jgi:exopolysaccharide biosynthesis polyprenyl glycosylphosphotransferase